MRNIFKTEINPKVFNTAATIAAVLTIIFGVSADALYDYFPEYAGWLLIGTVLIMIWLAIMPEKIRVKRTHLDPKKIFGGIDGTSNLKEEIIVSRIQQDALFVFANGASNMSLQRDLERIQFLAKARSMRKVEDFVDKFLTVLAIEHFSED